MYEVFSRRRWEWRVNVELLETEVVGRGKEVYEG